jgi:alpha-amylase
VSLQEKTRLVFALHFHQPYGNLDWVFADAMDRCYLRTLDLLADFPHVRAAIHVSGPLLDWSEAHRPELIDKLAKLVARGQVEVLGGGYQEPMLAVLPDRDAIGQLELMAERCQAWLGERPRGMWLTERVWEPDLARVIALAGYRYTLLDDSHLFAAGASKPLGDYYVTDKAGQALAVFPIDRGLRTRIPFADVEELFDYLRALRGRAPTYGDDVEKFGLWPTTFKRAWEDNWLERFFAAIRGTDIEVVTPAQVLDDTPSSGAVYIPTISYQEMGAWTLPAESSRQFQLLARRMHLGGFDAEAEAFLRGGIWQAFLAKYPEAHLIYRKMLRVSEAVERARRRGDARWQQAQGALYRGQCNCAYWHGLFGGLYLQHLRSALMGALIEAEDLIAPRDGVALLRRDHDGDLQEEILFEGPELNLYVKPSRGGSGIELDLRKARFHLTGVLGRRGEAYHEDVPRARVVSDEDLGNVSAHDLVRATEPNLEEKLLFDAYPRGAFVDHLLPAGAGPEMLDRGYAPIADLAWAHHQVEAASESDGECLLSLRAASGDFTLDKIYGLGNDHVEVSYRLERAGAPEELCFASQIDVTLLSPETAGGRRIEVVEPPRDAAERAPGWRGIQRDVRSLAVACDDLGVHVVIRAEPAAELWRLPIETVSQSERGFERSYQGTALVFVWRGRAGGGKGLHARLRLEVAPPWR